MASFNRVVLVGNLTRDPELRYTPSGAAVSEIGLAINDRVKRDGQWGEETTFVDVVLWNRTAEVANEYLSKGSPVLIEGRLKLDTWEKDGQKRSKLRVVASAMQMLGGRPQGEGGRSNQDHGSRGRGSGDSYGSGGGSEYGSPPSNSGGSFDEYGGGSSGSAPPSDEIPF